jgi:putative transposase
LKWKLSTCAAKSSSSGGCYFFKVNLLERRANNLLTDRINLLGDAVRRVWHTRPFAIDAWVVLPDHLHAVWTQPPGDDDFSTRWRLIKTFFARALPKTERLSRVRRADGERGIWQRRFWEHAIRLSCIETRVDRCPIFVVIASPAFMRRNTPDG